MANIFRIRDWAKHFENSRTKDISALNWVPIPNRLDGSAFTELLDHKDGEAHYGIWVIAVLVASRCSPRGSLIRSVGRAHDFDSLARVMHSKARLIESAFARLIEVGWIEVVTDIATLDGNQLPQHGNGLPLSRTEQKEGKGRALKADPEVVTSIYEAYPKKVAKQKAIAAIDRALEHVTPESLLAAVREYAASPAAKEIKYVPNPATWFNQKRWEDDRASWGTSAKAKISDGQSWLKETYIP